MLKDLKLIYGDAFVKDLVRTMYSGKTVISPKLFLNKLNEFISMRSYSTVVVTGQSDIVPDEFISTAGIYFHLPTNNSWNLLCTDMQDIYERKLFVLQKSSNVLTQEDSEKVNIICKKCPSLSYIYGVDFLQKVTPFITKQPDLISLQCVVEAISDYLNAPNCIHTTRYLNKVHSFILRDSTDATDCSKGICKSEFFNSGLYVRIADRWIYVVESVPEICLYHEFLARE